MAIEQMSINYEVGQRLRKWRAHFSEIFYSNGTSLSLGAMIGVFIDIHEHLAETGRALNPELLQEFAARYPRKGRPRKDGSGPLRREVTVVADRKRKAMLRGHAFRQITSAEPGIGRCPKCAAGLETRRPGEIYVDCPYAGEAENYRGALAEEFLAKNPMDWEARPGDVAPNP